jgi:hypothetical protein
MEHVKITQTKQLSIVLFLLQIYHANACGIVVMDVLMIRNGTRNEEKKEDHILPILHRVL